METLIEGHRVALELGPIAEWADWAWLEPGVLGLAALALVASLVLGHGLMRVLTGALAVAGGATGWLLTDVHRLGPALCLFPELWAQVEHLGRFPAVALGVAAGAALGAVVDSLAFFRGWGRAVGAGAPPLVALGLAALVYLGTGPARQYRDRLAELPPVPHLAFDEDDLWLHVGQERTVQPNAVTQLGVRQKLFIFVWGSPYYLPAEQLRAPEGPPREWGRKVLLQGEALAAWQSPSGGDPTSVALAAPAGPGPFEAHLELSCGPMRVETTVQATAVSDAGDPRFPLTGSTRRVFAGTWEHRGDAPAAIPSVILGVEEERVEEGFRRFVVVVEGIGEAPERVEVVPWDGTYRLGPSPEARPWIEAAPSPRSADRLLVDGQEVGLEPCRIPPLPGYCSCAREGPHPGPVACVDVDVDGTEVLVRGSLAVLTIGISEIAGLFRGSPETRTTLTLAEAEGEAVTVAPAEPPEPPRRGRVRPASRRRPGSARR